MLVLNMQPGHTLFIGHNVAVSCNRILGHSARIGVCAPSDVMVYRQKSLTVGALDRLMAKHGSDPETLLMLRELHAELHELRKTRAVEENERVYTTLDRPLPGEHLQLPQHD